MKYGQVIDGDWVEPTPQRGHRMKCCDCALVHDMDFRVKDGKVQFRPKRNKRATAAARRAQKVQEAFTKARRGKWLFGLER